MEGLTVSGINNRYNNDVVIKIGCCYFEDRQIDQWNSRENIETDSHTQSTNL